MQNFNMCYEKNYWNIPNFGKYVPRWFLDGGRVSRPPAFGAHVMTLVLFLGSVLYWVKPAGQSRIGCVASASLR